MTRLFWCTTSDHEEDWFLVADSVEHAAKAFAEERGYAAEEVQATCLAGIPPNFSREFCLRRTDRKATASADLRLLRDVGAEILRARSPSVVRLHGEIYVEGTPDIARNKQLDDALEAVGRGRPHGTRRHPHLQS